MTHVKRAWSPNLAILERVVGDLRNRGAVPGEDFLVVPVIAEPDNVPAVERGAATIDALFAPLQSPRRPGRVWVWDNGQLSSVDITLDYSNAEQKRCVP